MEIRKTTAVNFGDRNFVVGELALADEISGKIAYLETLNNRVPQSMRSEFIANLKARVKEIITRARKDTDFSAVITAMTSDEQKALLSASNSQKSLPTRAKGFTLFRNLFLETRNANNEAMSAGVDTDHLTRAIDATAESSPFFANITPKILDTDFSASKADEAEFRRILGIG